MFDGVILALNVGPGACFCSVVGSGRRLSFGRYAFCFGRLSGVLACKLTQCSELAL